MKRVLDLNCKVALDLKRFEGQSQENNAIIVLVVVILILKSITKLDISKIEGDQVK